MVMFVWTELELASEKHQTAIWACGKQHINDSELHIYFVYNITTGYLNTIFIPDEGIWMVLKIVEYE